MAFSRRRTTEENATARKAALPPVELASNVSHLKIDGLRLDMLDCAFLQVECACGHVGKVPVEPLVSRFGRAARVREALRTTRCSRCDEQKIRKIRALP